MECARGKQAQEPCGFSVCENEGGFCDHPNNELLNIPCRPLKDGKKDMLAFTYKVHYIQALRMLIKVNHMWKKYISVTESSLYCMCVSTCASHILISGICLHIYMIPFKITATKDLTKIILKV